MINPQCHRARTVIAGLSLLLFAIIYYALLFRYGLNLADEGNVALISLRLAHGEKPFIDLFLGYNLLWFYPISGLFRIFGGNLLLMRAYFYLIYLLSGLLAFFLLRLLKTPIWLAWIVSATLIAITGQYFKAYIPFLVILHLFCLTIFLKTSRSARVCLLIGVVLGMTFLIRIDLGIFFCPLWTAVFLFTALLFHRNLFPALKWFSLALLTAALVQVPLAADAFERGFSKPFLEQYRDVCMVMLAYAIPASTFNVPTRSIPLPADSSIQRPGSSVPPPTIAKIPKANNPSSQRLARRSLRDIVARKSTIERRLLAFLTYYPIFLATILLGYGFWKWRFDQISTENWLLITSLLIGCLTAFPQFFFFRPDLPHLIEFMNGAVVAFTGAIWLLGEKHPHPLHLAAILLWLSYFFLAFPNPYGGSLAQRQNRTLNFRGMNGVDVLLSPSEYHEVDGIASATLSHSKSDDFVVSYPYLPGINFITARPTFQHWLYVDDLTRSADWEETEIKRLKKFRPAVIVIDDWKINGTEESKFSNWARRTTEFIEQNYRMVMSLNKKRVFALP
ncbi:MAG: hypothetical protein JOY96_02170 [Verrucomicrobia bacterium]|nr:hypothetical protein [Verrucomicrobiota bacterium]